MRQETRVRVSMLTDHEDPKARAEFLVPPHIIFADQMIAAVKGPERQTATLANGHVYQYRRRDVHAHLGNSAAQKNRTSKTQREQPSFTNAGSDLDDKYTRSVLSGEEVTLQSNVCFQGTSGSATRKKPSGHTCAWNQRTTNVRASAVDAWDAHHDNSAGPMELQILWQKVIVTEFQGAPFWTFLLTRQTPPSLQSESGVASELLVHAARHNERQPGRADHKQLSGH